MYEKYFNVMVLGLSGCDINGIEYKVGKSLFCNRFVRPGKDDLVIDNRSVYSKELIYGPVINNDNFLYWGFNSMRVEGGENIKFNVVECTNLRSDDKMYIPELLYLRNSIIPKVTSLKKIMYISPEQVENIELYPKIDMPDGELTIHGFIILYNTDVRISYRSTQDEFVISAIKRIKKIGKGCIIVASKCDKSSSTVDFTKEIENCIKNKNSEFSLTTPIIETSALLNVNIISAFQVLYSITELKSSPQKIKNYYDSHRVNERLNSVLIDTFTKTVMNSTELPSQLTLEKIKRDPRNNMKIKNVQEIVGEEGLMKIFNECINSKISKLKEKLLQYYLNKFELCLSSITDSTDDINIAKIDEFIVYLKDKNILYEWFNTDESSSSDDLTSIEEKIAISNNITTVRNNIKIPLSVLNQPRFEVVFKQHMNKVESFSRKQKLKNEYEHILNELSMYEIFNINSTIDDIKNILDEKELNEVSENIYDESFKEIYNNVFQKILLKAKYELDELMFEKSNELKLIKYENKSQIVQDYSLILCNDPRFTIFNENLESLRNNWIFTHFTFVSSSTFCLLSPLSPCCDRLAKNALSSLCEQSELLVSINEENFIILFVIAPDDVYNYFLQEFLQLTVQTSQTCYELTLNARNKRITPVKISSLDIDWYNILKKYKDEHFSFMAIYGDCNSYKFVESVLSKLYVTFSKIWKNTCIDTKHTIDIPSNIEKISSTNTSMNSVPCMNNIVITFCLLPHVVDEYRNFITRTDDSSFFQESMLGRLLELGRTLSNKLSAKLIEPYLDEIMDKKILNPIHETQIIDSIKFLHETILDDDESILLKHSKHNIVRIIVCCMCGDNYPLEIIISMLIYNQKYKYSNRRETVYFEFNYENHIWLISIRIVSYHSAYLLFNREEFHGCILVYNTTREASYQMMRSFVQKEHDNIFHFLGISGFSSHSRITVQKTMTSDEFINIERSELEMSDLNLSRDISTQVQNLRVFLINSTKLLMNKNKISGIRLLSPTSSFYDHNVKYGTFQFRRPSKESRNIINDQLHHQLPRISPTPSQVKPPDVNVSWSVNPNFSIKNDTSLDRHLSEMNLVPSHEKVKFKSSTLRRTKQDSVKVGTLKQLRGITKMFDKKSNDTKEIPSNTKDSTAKSTLNKNMNWSRTSVSEDTKKQQSRTNIFTAAFSNKKRVSEQSYEDKLSEWEKNFTNKSKLSEFKYFGKPLDEVPCYKNIPIFVIKCVFFIEENGITLEGLYRKSGLKQDIESLKNAFDADYQINFNKLGFSVHVYTSALKYFFSNIPNYLIPTSLNNEILTATSQTDPNERIEHFKNIILKLPTKNYQTLSFLIQHFSRIHELREKNKMDARNLAICFWPNLIHFTASSMDIGSMVNGSNMLFNLFIHTLIENSQSIFTDQISITLEELDDQ